MVYPVNDTEADLIAISRNQFDIKKFIFKLLKYLPWIIASLLIAYLLGNFYLRYTPQLHRISARMLIKDENESSSDYKILRELGVMPGSKEVQNQIDIIESYGLMKGIVDSLDLQLQLFAEGRITTTPLYGNKRPLFIHVVSHSDSAGYHSGNYKIKPLSSKFALMSAKDTVFYKYFDTINLEGYKIYFSLNNSGKLSQEPLNLKVLSVQPLAMSLSKAVDVRKVNEMGGIIEISMLDEDPERAKDILNTLIRAYNTAGVTDKNVVGVKTVQFLNDRIDTVAQELNAIELRAERFKSSNKITDQSSAGDSYLTEVMNYDNQGILQKSQMELLESLEAFIKNSTRYTDIIPSTNTLSEPTLSKLIDDYNSTVLEFQNQTQISTEKDPTVARIKTYLAQLKGNILKNILSIKSAYRTHAVQLTNTKNNFEALLAAVPEKERELLGMKRQIGVKEQLYLYLLQKKEETDLALSSNINNTRIVNEAFDEGVKEPNSQQIILFSVLVGLIAPIGFILLFDFFNNKILDKAELEEGTKTPVIGELSYDKKNQNAVINAKSRSIIAEQVRLIRTNLNYLSSEEKIKTILITSFMSGEGKSFVSINFAASLASSEAKVLLIEMDLRKPKFSKYLDVQPKLGLTDLIVGNHHYSKAVFTTLKLQNVDIIASGPIPPNPTELLISSRLKQIIQEVQQNYDYVVIDSSPVGLVADAFSLQHFSDLTLFIVRQKYTFKTTIKFIESLYRQNKFKKLAIVVNGITDMKSFGYGYGYSYGYYYGDNYYGVEKERKGLAKAFWFLGK